MIEFPPDGDDVISASSSSGCLTVAGESSSPASPWTFGGSMSIGKGCAAPNSQFSLAGRVNVAYGYGFEISKDLSVRVAGMTIWSMEINFQCNLGVSGYIGGRTGTYTYYTTDPCPSRRLGVNATAVGKTNDEEDLEDDLSEEDGPLPGFSESRRLLSRRLDKNSAPARRLGKSRRRRSCNTQGFEMLAGLGVGGGCSVFRRRIGVSIEGGFDVTLGPFPEPLDARAKGEISAKGCIKIGPYKGCIGFPSQKLFDESI